MCQKKRFPEMTGLMWVDIDGNYHFFDNCPADLREKVEKEWPEYKKEVLAKKRNGIEDSREWF